MQALSLGACVDVWAPQTGVVHSVFRRAVNLLVEGELWTVLPAAGHDIPFGIRLCAGSAPGGFGVKPDDPVCVRAGHLSIGKRVIDCRAASRWTPEPWAAPSAFRAERLVLVERAARSRAWPGSADMARALTTALRRPASGLEPDLVAAVRKVVGRGPGLTPAGDDVLVGMFSVLASGADGTTGRRYATRLARALAPALPSTTDISRHLIDQAARGLPGRALHELGRALIEGAPENAIEAALARVLDTGATSGADACIGLAAAVQLLFPSSARAAA